MYKWEDFPISMLVYLSDGTSKTGYCPPALQLQIPPLEGFEMESWVLNIQYQNHKYTRKHPKTNMTRGKSTIWRYISYWNGGFSNVILFFRGYVSLQIHPLSSLNFYGFHTPAVTAVQRVSGCSLRSVLKPTVLHCMVSSSHRRFENLEFNLRFSTEDSLTQHPGYEGI